MADINLSAELREGFGKGAARTLRRAGRVPAVVYGHGTDPVHISVDAHTTRLALRHANALFELEIAGGENTLAIAREVQKHPVSRELEHIDFVIVRRGEKVEVDVPLTLVGEAAPSTLVQHEELTLAVLADATALPESISVDITGRGVGEHVFAKDIALPAGVELVADPELLVVNVSAEISEAQLEAELGETPADDEAAAEETPAAE